MKKRESSDPPRAIAERGWRYHHIGIPTKKIKPGERQIKELGMHVSGFEESEFGIEWMRFEPDSPISEIIRNLPHIAFEVDHLEEALKGRNIISGISSPSPGVKVAMIIEDGLPVELMEFIHNNQSDD